MLFYCGELCPTLFFSVFLIPILSSSALFTAIPKRIGAYDCILSFEMKEHGVRMDPPLLFAPGDGILLRYYWLLVTVE